MAGGMDLGTGGRGGKKPLDTAINLVPFIDLMAVTISFLIMTAVWTQIGRLQVAQSANNADSNDQQNDQKPFILLITEKELKLNMGGAALEPIAITRLPNNKIDTVRLEAKLKELKGSQPDQASITIQSEDAVRYDDLVTIIDKCIGAGLPNISVSPAMG